MRISDWSSDVCSSDLHGSSHGRSEEVARRRSLCQSSFVPISPAGTTGCFAQERGQTTKPVMVSDGKQQQVGVGFVEIGCIPNSNELGANRKAPADQRSDCPHGCHRPRLLRAIRIVLVKDFLRLLRCFNSRLKLASLHHRRKIGRRLPIRPSHSTRSEERRVGKEGVSTFRSRGSPYN